MHLAAAALEYVWDNIKFEYVIVTKATIIRHKFTEN